MYVHILNENKGVIENRLAKELPGVTLKVFKSAVEYKEYVTKSAALLDMLIITDAGVSGPDKDINENIIALKELLSFQLFTCDTIICLNKISNEEHFDKYTYLKGILNREQKNLEILKYNIVDLEVLKQIITRNTTAYKPPLSKKKAVIQVDRDSKVISSKVITELSTPGAMAVELRVDPTEQIIKANNMGNKTKIEVEKGVEATIVEMDGDISIDFETVLPKRKHIKYIVTTGLGGGGVSTTALTMAMTGADEGKTLLIDADPNLGLSYIVENKIAESKYHRINLEEILSEKDDAINKYFNAVPVDKNLHIMVGTLPTLRAIGVEALEFVILNILSTIEERYKYIVIDLPLSISSKYTNLLGKADLILSCCPPYKHKFVPLLNALKTSVMVKTKAYKRNMFFNYFTGAADLNRLNTVKIQSFTTYSKAILEKELKCTKPYICRENRYVALDMFQGIVSAAEEIYNSVEEES